MAGQASRLNSIKRRHLLARPTSRRPTRSGIAPLAALPTISLPGSHFGLGTICAPKIDRQDWMSDFGPTSIHTDYAGRCCHSPTLRLRLPRQQPDSDADRAMEYLAL
jgi:hypothetical protein